MIKFVTKAKFVPHWGLFLAFGVVLVGYSLILHGMNNYYSITGRNLTCQTGKASSNEDSTVSMIVKCEHGGKMVSYTVNDGKLVIDVLTKQAKVIHCDTVNKSGNLSGCKIS